mmetsp:Transcript_14106/g.30586  ORF Transcript_14106/g.30586 Transcript_14106/m.30586 type:complete len:283 (-) Transcript_14106:418-1266(-)|eukprot:CAMPEP_0202912674 /NCGR_PEP_ID=MMETSP1392-20130828/58390_1 /ASSEMBLY_ACC=CAM_ASM_000868 /TAXON_ID=225041 /ORGANISM="Chlamydomonas chlamydogama, Strain SAG 11-48b" /LENGTH=282 /DNA_ID=CAMNT_0049603669 /DNA_START=146 /DNA_END=997 /DNA_ORIENTATION=-
MSDPILGTSVVSTYGSIAGSSPNWAAANLHDRGRAHASHSAVSELGSTGLQGWYSSSAAPEKPMRRMFEAPSTATYAEPVVQGAHTSYYGRRAVSESPTAFRRSIRQVADPGPLRPERPEGKRAIAEPYGPGPRAMGTRPPPDDVRFKEAQHAPEPAMPRLSRPVGLYGLRESDQELSYERAMGRKVRVDHMSYHGTGRAGDKSTSFAPPARPEDDPVFFKTLKDSPTFIRFCSTLPPKPAVSPHERRAASMQRANAREMDQERQLVASLQLPDPDEPPPSS